MTATELTYDIPMVITPRPPKPEACREPTVASVVVWEFEQPNGFKDRQVTITRSCGHWYYGSGNPVIGSPAMTCLGPQVETAVSGRADKSLPPMKKGKRWTKLKGAA